jgi:hypothetical protein
VPKTLALPGIEAFVGQQLHYHRPVDMPSKGERLLVMGDGDAALQAAIDAAQAGVRVTLMHRRDAFKAEATRVNEVKALRDNGGITFLAAQAVGFEASDGQLRANNHFAGAEEYLLARRAQQLKVLVSDGLDLRNVVGGVYGSVSEHHTVIRHHSLISTCCCYRVSRPCEITTRCCYVTVTSSSPYRCANRCSIRIIKDCSGKRRECEQGSCTRPSEVDAPVGRRCKPSYCRKLRIVSLNISTNR